MSLLDRELVKWIQSLDLSYTLKNPRRDLANGFLAAEILSRYDKEISMHSFDTGLAMARKLDNWEQIQKILTKRGCSTVTQPMVDGTIQGRGDGAREILEKLYEHLTNKKLQPNLEKLQQKQDGVNKKTREILDAPAFARPTAAALMRETNDETIQRLQKLTSRTNEDNIAAVNAQVLETHQQLQHAHKIKDPDHYRPKPPTTGGQGGLSPSGKNRPAWNGSPDDKFSTRNRDGGPNSPDAKGGVSKSRQKLVVAKQLDVKVADESIVHAFAVREAQAREDALRAGFDKDNDLSSALSQVVYKILHAYGLVDEVNKGCAEQPTSELDALMGYATIVDGEGPDGAEEGNYSGDDNLDGDEDEDESHRFEVSDNANKNRAVISQQDQNEKAAYKDYFFKFIELRDRIPDEVKTYIWDTLCSAPSPNASANNTAAAGMMVGFGAGRRHQDPSPGVNGAGNNGTGEVVARNAAKFLLFRPTEALHLRLLFGFALGYEAAKITHKDFFSDEALNATSIAALGSTTSGDDEHAPLDLKSQHRVSFARDVENVFKFLESVGHQCVANSTTPQECSALLGDFIVPLLSTLVTYGSTFVLEWVARIVVAFVPLRGGSDLKNALAIVKDRLHVVLPDGMSNIKSANGQDGNANSHNGSGAGGADDSSVTMGGGASGVPPSTTHGLSSMVEGLPSGLRKSAADYATIALGGTTLFDVHSRASSALVTRYYMLAMNIISHFHYRVGKAIGEGYKFLCSDVCTISVAVAKEAIMYGTSNNKPTATAAGLAMLRRMLLPFDITAWTYTAAQRPLLSQHQAALAAALAAVGSTGSSTNASAASHFSSAVLSVGANSASPIAAACFTPLPIAAAVTSALTASLTLPRQILVECAESDSCKIGVKTFAESFWDIMALLGENLTAVDQQPQPEDRQWNPNFNVDGDEQQQAVAPERKSTVLPTSSEIRLAFLELLTVFVFRLSQAFSNIIVESSVDQFGGNGQHNNGALMLDEDGNVVAAAADFGLDASQMIRFVNATTGAEVDSDTHLKLQLYSQALEPAKALVEKLFNSFAEDSSLIQRLSCATVAPFLAPAEHAEMAEKVIQRLLSLPAKATSPDPADGWDNAAPANNHTGEATAPPAAALVQQTSPAAASPTFEFDLLLPSGVAATALPHHMVIENKVADENGSSNVDQGAPRGISSAVKARQSVEIGVAGSEREYLTLQNAIGMPLISKAVSDSDALSGIVKTVSASMPFALHRLWDPLVAATSLGVATEENGYSSWEVLRVLEGTVLWTRHLGGLVEFTDAEVAQATNAISPSMPVTSSTATKYAIQLASPAISNLLSSTGNASTSGAPAPAPVNPLTLYVQRTRLVDSSSSEGWKRFISNGSILPHVTEPVLDPEANHHLVENEPMLIAFGSIADYLTKGLLAIARRARRASLQAAGAGGVLNSNSSSMIPPQSQIPNAQQPPTSIDVQDVYAREVQQRCYRIAEKIFSDLGKTRFEGFITAPITTGSVASGTPSSLTGGKTGSDSLANTTAPSVVSGGANDDDDEDEDAVAPAVSNRYKVDEDALHTYQDEAIDWVSANCA